MKTLDEVIELCEKALWCAYLPQDDTTTTAGLALHYLKEYREKHDDILRMEEALGYCEISDNPPLTWDELKQMEGKPVWVEVYDPIDEKSGWHTAYWTLIEFINGDYICLRDNGGEQQIYQKQSKTWQAYRKGRGKSDV